MEAVLRIGQDAYLTHDAVLSLHNFALVNPSVIRVGTPKRTWAHHPEWLQVIKQIGSHRLRRDPLRHRPPGSVGLSGVGHG